MKKVLEKLSKKERQTLNRCLKDRAFEKLITNYNSKNDKMKHVSLYFYDVKFESDERMNNRLKSATYFLLSREKEKKIKIYKFYSFFKLWC